jgi:long-chain acyl-CoA synthetase
MWSAWWAGLAVAPDNAGLHPRETEWIVDNAQACWAFLTSDAAPVTLAGLERQVDVESVECEALLALVDDWRTVPIAERRADDLAWLFYLSGITGRPNEVKLTCRNLMVMG